MKKEEYRAMLRSVEQALKICDQSVGYMDQVHREICEQLRITRDRLRSILGVEPEAAG